MSEKKRPWQWLRSEVFAQNFPLVTRGQFTSQIIISGRYRRYLQTWHLPPPHIIFPCNKSGFPAPGTAGGFVTTGHNYQTSGGQSVSQSVINQFLSSTRPSRLPWIESFVEEFIISTCLLQNLWWPRPPREVNIRILSFLLFIFCLLTYSATVD